MKRRWHYGIVCVRSGVNEKVSGGDQCPHVRRVREGGVGDGGGGVLEDVQEYETLDQCPNG